MHDFTITIIASEKATSSAFTSLAVKTAKARKGRSTQFNFKFLQFNVEKLLVDGRIGYFDNMFYNEKLTILGFQ